MSDEDEDSEEEGGKKGPKCPLSVYIGEGKLQYLRGQYEKAIACFDIVLERDPRNVKILVARSKCYSYLMQYDLAMKDAQDALAIDSKYAEAICQKGETEYVMGDFEFAYLTFQRGYSWRPTYEAFRLGFQKCEAAILNSIGPRARLQPTAKDIEMVEKKLRMKPKRTTDKDSEKITQHILPKVDYKARIILGKAGYDKEFFQQVLAGERIHEGVSPDSYKAAEYCQQALNFLEGRQKFWQMERPLHSQKKVICTLRSPISNHYRKGKEDTGEFDTLPLPMKTQRYLNAAKSALANKDNKKAIYMCNKIFETLSDAPFGFMLNKNELMADTLGTIGVAYERDGQLDPAVTYHKRQNVVASKIHSEEYRYRALRNLAHDYVRAQDYGEAIECYEDMLARSKSKKSRVFVLHEIGQCQLSTNKLDAARDSGLRCLRLAEELEDSLSEMNADILLARIATGSTEGHHEDAVTYYERALELASMLDDGNLKKTIERALEKIRSEQTEQAD